MGLRRIDRKPNYFLISLFGLEGKTVVLTGACGFLGRNFSQGLLSAGARLVMLSRSDEVFTRQQRYASRFGKKKVAAYQTDFYDERAFDEALEKISEREDVQILVNNAYDMSQRTGLNSPQGRLESASVTQWRDALESGLISVARITQCLGKKMKKAGKGSIINISSMYALVSPHPELYKGTKFLNPPFYSVTKGGLLAFTRYVASFWGKYGIRCNAIAPGPFPNVQGSSANSVQRKSSFLSRVSKRTLLQRTGRPEELLGALLFLASDASSYVTGQTIVVDGGWTVT